MECIEKNLKIADKTEFPLKFSFMFTLLGMYLIFIKVIGPNMMKTRKPYQLNAVIIIYNLAQIYMNIYLLAKYFRLMGVNGLMYGKNVCNPVSAIYPTNQNMELEIRENLYLYYLNKYTDLLDTIFFILRKKDKQVSFLHVSHHILVIITTWIPNSYHSEEITVMFAALNEFIHVVMYTYYLLSGFGPSVQKYLWWKKYLTQMQLVQFFIMLFCIGKIIIKGCVVNEINIFALTSSLILYVVLFINFYVRSYKRIKSS